MFKWYWPTTRLIYVWRRGSGRWVVSTGVVWKVLVMRVVAVTVDYRIPRLQDLYHTNARSRSGDSACFGSI